jgi:hypothetical protein
MVTDGISSHHVTIIKRAGFDIDKASINSLHPLHHYLSLPDPLSPRPFTTLLPFLLAPTLKTQSPTHT